MADQTQRLEIATVRAEVGSNIVFRFANDAATAGSIPTESGGIQNLKQIVLEIQQDAANKISISTTIYHDVATGLAATADQGIFLVQSSEADEIYTVWQNQGGAAVSTGKTALSATAIQAALDASNEAAQAAEDAADAATTRTARYLAPSDTPPVVRDNGLPLEVGDIWFNTIDQTEYRYTTDGWRANDSVVAIEELESQISVNPGPGRIPRSNERGLIDLPWLEKFVQPGASGAEKSISDKIGEILSPTDYASVSAAINRAISQGLVIEARKSLVVRIPSDAPTLQTAFDHISASLSQVRVTLLIEAGYSLSTAVYLHDGDYSNFRITSEDPVVNVSSLMPRMTLIRGINAKMPNLACLINANGFGLDGITLDSCSMTIEEGCGVYNAYSSGLLGQSSSQISARKSNFTYASRSGTTGAGITAWASSIDATEADVSFSGYYGGQAAHGGSLTLEKGKANDCRYGVRGSDDAHVDFSEGQASRCSVYGLYSFQNSNINAPGATANDCGSANLVAANVSKINFRGGTATGAKKTAPAGAPTNYGHNAFIVGGSEIDLFNAIMTGAAGNGLHCESSNASVGGADFSGAADRGVFGDDGSNIRGKLAKANSCKVGAHLVNGGKLSSREFSATNCAETSVLVDDGAEVTIPLAALTGAGVNGVRVLNGSKANIRNANCRRGSVDDPTDIQCYSGASVTATGSTGGLNRTANTVSAQGIIYK